MALITTPGELKNRADFFLQISSMLDAGLPLPRILSTLHSGAGSRNLREMSGKMATWIDGGHTFSEACAEEMSWATPFELALIHSGETSGTLERSIKQLGDYLDRKATLIRQTIGYFIYPIMVVHVALFVFPVHYLQGLLNAGGLEALLIQKLIAFSLLYALVLGGLWFYQHTNTTTAIRIKYAIFSWIPLLGSSLKELALARLALALHALYNAGVSVGKAWKLAADASSNSRIKAEVDQWIPLIEDEGISPAELLGSSRYFPAFFIASYQTGETSGKLDDSLKRIEINYSESGMSKLAMFSQWVPRLVYFLIVIIIAIQIISFYSGMFQQTNQFLE